MRRLGLLRELSQVGDRVPVLPFIDTEVRFSLDTRRVLFTMENVLTTDKVFLSPTTDPRSSQKRPDTFKCAVDCRGEAIWRICDTTKCCIRTQDASKVCFTTFPFQITRTSNFDVQPYV